MEVKNQHCDMMEEENSILLMSPDRIRRSVGRMAYQIAEDFGEESSLLIVGLKIRGFAVAEMLAEHLSSVLNNPVECVQLQVGNGDTAVFKNSVKSNRDVSYVVLADDVIFTGCTMLAAMQEVLQHFNPSILRTAVLVDRGNRKVPVEVTFSGLELPTKMKEHVQVVVEEAKPERVILTKTDD